MLLVVTALLMSACQPGQENVADSPPANQPDDLSVRKQMLEHKTKYIGDLSVMNMLDYFPEFDQNYVRNMLALQTDVEPYGIIIYYEPSEKFNGSPMTISDGMVLYANFLFECVDNLGYVVYKYRTSPSSGKLNDEEYETLTRVDQV
jgi:hypothetical protein